MTHHQTTRTATIVTTISTTMAIATQRYGGGTISGASAVNSLALSANNAAWSLSVSALRSISVLAAAVDTTASPSTWAAHNPTATLNAPPASHAIRATNG